MIDTLKNLALVIAFLMATEVMLAIALLISAAVLIICMIHSIQCKRATLPDIAPVFGRNS